jgi:hypothetical protein
MTQAVRKLSVPEQANENLYCSFCLKPAEEVKKLVAGHGRIFICDECVAACNDYITLGKSERSRRKSLKGTLTERLLTLLKPVEETIEGKSNQLQSLVEELPSEGEIQTETLLRLNHIGAPKVLWVVGARWR